MLKGELRKVEKYLHRDLEYLMRESKIIQDLKNDVEKIKGVVEKAKESKKVTLILYYYTRDAHKKERLSERIERRLNQWVERLEKLLSNNYFWENVSGDEKEQLNTLKSQIDICKNNLTRILAWNGELHTLVQEENWKKVEDKIDEVLGNRTSPGICSLMIILEHMEQVEQKNRKLIDSSNNPLKMLEELEKNPHLVMVTEFLNKLSVLILEGDFNFKEIIILMNKWYSLNRQVKDDTFNVFLDISVKLCYILFDCNKKIKRIENVENIERWSDFFDLSNAGNKSTLIKCSLYLIELLSLPFYENKFKLFIGSVESQEDTIREYNEFRLNKRSYLDRAEHFNSDGDDYGNSSYSGITSKAFLFYLVKSRNLPPLMTKALLYYLLNIHKLFRDEKAKELLWDGLIEFGLFKGLVVSEVGGNIYDQHWSLFKKEDFLRKNPKQVGILQTQSGSRHQFVYDNERVNLDTWKKWYPVLADFSMSARVISGGSGMEYGEHSQAYCAMELLTCFANMTKKGGYSIHYIEVGPYISHPKFMEFIGLELVDESVDLYVFKKLNHTKITTEQFSKWFYQNLAPYRGNEMNWVMK